MADANQNQVFRWEERNTLTWRIYDNSDSLMRWTDGSLVHLQQSVDITDSLRLHKEANYDELTGLLNRRAGEGRACQRAGTPRQGRIFLDRGDVRFGQAQGSQ